MWHTGSFHQQRETEFLDEALRRVTNTPAVFLSADAILSGASQAEPLIAEVLQTPQDIRYHAEGPFVHAHVKSMLCTIYAMQKEELHLIDIEELRRLKGYEGEIEELELTFKENIGLFEVFALMHDIAKWTSIVFSAPKGSEGDRLGFNAPPTYEITTDAKRRVELRSAYTELFHEFAKEHPNESARTLQKRFYETYEIDVHYPHHDTLIYTPVYQALLDRFVVTHRLTGRNRNLLEDLIAHHMQFGLDFSEVNPSHVKRTIYLAEKRGYDAENYLRLSQACMFLDMVCGSVITVNGEPHHRIAQFANALKSEHDYAPERRIQKEMQRKTLKNKERNQVFQQVGLDGVALLDLFKMDPGPAFGNLLRQIQEAVVGQGSLPKVPTSIQAELDRRISAFYQTTFKHGI
ncbi:MAG: hypothetical protein NTX72_04815 [Candidatus Uhrbacteria bacterium]|nr:hypothetical protein [Candidatus Uhrbacteria bacterium]